MLNKNGLIGVRLPKTKLAEYLKCCSDVNSLMSIRIRKFIEFELEYNKEGNDLLKEIEKLIKKHGKK